MATSETEVQVDSTPTGAGIKVRPVKQSESWIDAILRVLSSVRFGIIMLSILLICCMIGMLIVQVELEDFPQYFAKLTPAQRYIYTKLNLVDIYHSWYFTLLLSVTALNIILASIDRFPTAWQYIVNPKVKASPNFIRAQNFSAEISRAEKPETLAAQIVQLLQGDAKIKSSVTMTRLNVLISLLIMFGSFYLLIERTVIFWVCMGIALVAALIFVVRGLRFDIRTTKENDRYTIFGQLNAWNRLGAYLVHVALMIIFIGGFLTNRSGIGGMMEIVPGESSNTFITIEATIDGPKNGQAQLPFTIECTDLQQKLIRPEGGLEATNTIDWLSYVRIKDGDLQKEALVHLNNPYDYKGYRLFQSKFTAFGYARSILVRFEPTSGGAAKEVVIPRNGTTDVEGIGKVTYKSFYPDFQITDSGPTSISPDYNNPAAQLEITQLDGQRKPAFAFNSELAERFLGEVGTKTESGNELLLINGHKVLLVSFEKAAMGHTLAVQYDPGRLPAYIGFLLLCAALCAVFFFSHQRVWVVVESEGTGSKVYLGGNTNRNKPAFEGRFNSINEAVKVEGKNE